ncbi:MAG TPA: S16 family serine protease, partial [Gaiellaceae bacterium]|nr:S16 family serine protease [Gaiellaceae bacterium]
MKLFRPGRLLVAGLVLLAVVLALVVVPSHDYIFLPDRAHPVAPLVTVEGGHDPTRGGVYFVDVVVRKATVIERLFGGLHKGADLYPPQAVNPPGVNQQERHVLDIEDMHRSQQIAAAVALRAAGRKVLMRPVGARIAFVQQGLPAFRKLEPGDVVVAIDGRPVHTLHDVFVRMTAHHVGDIVAFTIRRGKRTLVERMKTVGAGKGANRRPVVGVGLEPALDIHLPVSVRIDAGNVGGPSAGVAFALEVLEELGRDVVHGHKIAATGEIDPDGSIGPIGGVKQKTIGAREAHVDAFVVPAGENASEARKYAGGLKIIPVETFPQV